MKKRQKFSAEFKREAVRQLRESGLSPLLGAKGHCRTVQRRILPTPTACSGYDSNLNLDSGACDSSAGDGGSSD